jgi:hypothetical protein
MKIECEGFEIAYSNHDEACFDCRVAIKCAKSTKLKLTEAGIETGKEKEIMIKDREKFEAVLASIKTKKGLGELNKTENLGVTPPKGATMDVIKDLLLASAFPETATEDPDDDFDADDLDGSSDDDDFGDNDADSDTEASDKVEETPVDDGDADVTEEDLVESEEAMGDLGSRVLMLEKRLNDLFELIEKRPPADAPATGKVKATKAEKDAAKAELVKGCPYTKDSIADLNARQVKQLASGLGINSFAKKTPAVVAMVLKSKTNKTINN